MISSTIINPSLMSNNDVYEMLRVRGKLLLQHFPNNINWDLSRSVKLCSAPETVKIYSAPGTLLNGLELPDGSISIKTVIFLIFNTTSRPTKLTEKMNKLTLS